MKINSNWFNCEHPRMVKNRYTNELVQVSCGFCPACRVRKMKRWIAPLAREGYASKYTFFVTLTYNDFFLPRLNIYDYVPLSKYAESFQEAFNASREFISLHDGFIPYCPSSDLKNFLKRLRENIFRSYGKRNVFRYFFSSDFGSTLFRPHWHGLIFTNDDQFAHNIESFLFSSWCISNHTKTTKKSLGYVWCRPAYDGGTYVAAYIQSIDKLPAIYSFRDLRPRSFHSSFPPIGSIVSPLQSPYEIVVNGLTEVNVYNPKTFEFERVPLQTSLVRRLFPCIPSFASLSKDERLRIYRIIYDSCDLTPKERRKSLRYVMSVNTFFRDYITLNNPNLTFRQINDKLDRVFYAFQRLHFQSKIFNVSYSDYDDFISAYFRNRYNQSLIKQFDYESEFLKVYPNSNDILNNTIDLALRNNERNVHSYKVVDVKSPRDFDSEYFLLQRKYFNQMTKRKCDRSYLEHHPEFKKFHS